MRYLLDTNICIHMLRGQYGVKQKIEQVNADNCCISEITKAELLVGAKYSNAKGYVKTEAIVKKFLTAIDVVPICDCLEYYAQEKVRLRLEGTSIEDFDLLIGCSCVCEGCVLVTENTRHFSKIQGVRVENWVDRL